MLKIKQRKPFFQCERRQRYNNMQEITQNTQNFVDYIDSFHLKPIFTNGKLVLTSKQPNDAKVEAKESIQFTKVAPFGEESSLNKALLCKDTNCISDKSYRCMKDTLIPKNQKSNKSLYSIKRLRKELNRKFQLRQCEHGYFVNVEQKFRTIFVKNILKNHFKHIDDTLYIKLSADGTNVRRRKILNVTFTILNEGQKAKRASGNYTLGVFGIKKESYEELEGLQELFDELEQIREIDILDKQYKIKYLFTSDWKLTSNILGLNGPNALRACTWCKCLLRDPEFDINKEWSMHDANDARTIEEALKILRENTTPNQGYLRTPILQFIPISNFTMDMLHLNLRLPGKLIELLFQELKSLDARNYLNVSSRVEIFRSFLEDQCNIANPILSENNSITIKDFTGPQKIKIFQRISFEELYLEADRIDNIKFLWNDYVEIFNLVKKVEIPWDELKIRTKNWQKVFLDVYHSNEITPYIHAFVHHLHEFVKLYEDVDQFTLEGLEKLNDQTTRQVFRGTNGKDFLRQLIQMRNRIDYLNL